MNLLLDDVFKPTFDLGRRQSEAVNYRGDHCFSSRAERVGLEFWDGIRRFSNDNVGESLGGCHSASELRKGVRRDHHRGNAALFEGERDVATPRRAGPSVARGSDNDIDARGEVIEFLARRVDQLPLDRRVNHRLFHNDSF